MAYATGNPKTKAELKRQVAAGQFVQAYDPFGGKPLATCEAVIEGPQYPKPHRWYARVRVVDGVITAVLA